MRILAIDTASDRFALALARDGEVLASVLHDSPREHTTSLLPAVEALLEGDRRIDGVLVTLGPGSYAGLRVGIATAEGLGLALGVPVRGIPTFVALAAAVRTPVDLLVHPAGRGQFAVQALREGEPVGPLEAKSAGDLAGLRLAGEGAELLAGEEIGPLARCVAGLQRAIATDLFARATADLDAIYLREPHITLPRSRTAT